MEYLFYLYLLFTKQLIALYEEENLIHEIFQTFGFSYFKHFLTHCRLCCKVFSAIPISQNYFKTLSQTNFC